MIAGARQLRETGVRSPYMLAMLAEIYEEESRGGREESRKEAVCACAMVAAAVLPCGRYLGHNC
jgi:hypothetical protein